MVNWNDVVSRSATQDKYETQDKTRTDTAHIIKTANEKKSTHCIYVCLSASMPMAVYACVVRLRLPAPRKALTRAACLPL